MHSKQSFAMKAKLKAAVEHELLLNKPQAPIGRGLHLMQKCLYNPLSFFPLAKFLK
jgi:hypothetical protein